MYFILFCFVFHNYCFVLFFYSDLSTSSSFCHFFCLFCSYSVAVFFLLSHFCFVPPIAYFVLFVAPITIYSFFLTSILFCRYFITVTLFQLAFLSYVFSIDSLVFFLSFVPFSSCCFILALFLLFRSPLFSSLIANYCFIYYHRIFVLFYMFFTFLPLVLILLLFSCLISVFPPISSPFYLLWQFAVLFLLASPFVAAL